MASSVRTRAAAAAVAVALLGLGMAGTATGQGTIEVPLDQLPPPGPVPNSLPQAYFGVPPPDPDAGPPTGDLFFTGEPTDQLNKATGSPTATFSEEAPTGSEAIEQTSDNLANSEVPGDPLALYWTGPFSGELDTELVLRWWFTSANAVSFVIANPVQVTVFADPDLSSGEPQPDRIIGQADVQITVGASPTYNESDVKVTGTVEETLLIQAKPLFTDGGRDLRVVYGAEATPSGFGIPLSEAGEAGEAPPALQSIPAAYDGPHVQLQRSYVGRESAEPTVGILEDGETAFYAAGAFDALPGQSPAQLARTEVLRSQDGGLTWTSVQPEIAPGLTGPPTTLDPYVYVDEATDRIFNPELYAGCSYLNYSDDGGATWSTNELACGEFVNDHQTIYAGPPPEGVETDGYPNVLYYCFNRVIDSNCGRSLDGGASFDPALGEPAFLGFDPAVGNFCGGLHGHITVDSAGRVFVPKGHCGFPWVAISEDAGATWEQVQVSDVVGSGSHTHLAVTVDDADNVYFLWWDGEDRLPWLAVSTDHGRTWSEPRMVAPPGVYESNFPILDGGAAGHIAMTFPGGTQPVPEDPAAAALRPWNSYVVVSTNATDPNPLFLSATANDPDDPIHRGPCEGRCAGMFDFLETKVSSTGQAWATATDTCMALTNDCISADAPDDDNDNDGTPNAEDGSPQGVANDAQGIAIRQIGGPDLRPDPAAPAPPPGPGTGGAGGVPSSPAPSPAPSGGLPATGGGLAVGALLLVVLARAVRSRR